MAGRLAAHIGVLLLCNVCVSGTWTLDPRPPATLQNDADGSEAVPRGAVSLAFVLDVTGSMHDDLVQVADGLKGILDVTLSRKDALFYSYVLVPFHDPVVGPAFVTRDPEEFQQRLENLTVSGGGDCPEMALTAVREALRLSLPSSYVYVFTDASSKDFHLLDQVLDLVQTKGSQVVFVTTGDCGDTSQPGYRAFERIAATSSGQVFHLNKSDVNEVLDFVKLSIRPRHVNLVSIDASPSTEQVLELNIDSTIVEFTVSMAGHNPRLAVVDPQGRVLEHGAELSVVLDLKNALIIRVQRPTVGRWLLRASGNGSHSIRATGVSEAQFTHGFSREPTDTLSETQHRPLEGVPTYLLVNGTKRAVFTELRLLSLRGETLAEGVPLHPVPNRPTLFNSSSFVPPDDFFYLEVIGTDPEGFPLSRIAQTAIKAQPPAAPEVETESVVEVHVGGNASLGCHVGTQVPFVAHWLKDGLPVTGPQKFRQSAEYPLHLIRVSAKDAGLYVCRASNEVGVTNAATSVRIRDSIPVQNSSFVSGGRAVLPCKPPGTKMATPNGVTWYRLRSGAVEQAWEVVPQDGRLHKGLNGSLVLEDVDAVDEGTYECVPADGTTRFRHQLVVLVAPKVQLNPDTVTFGPGDHFEVTCTASGAPAPRVWWAVPAELRSRIEPKGQRLVVHSARAGDELEEVYCVAANQAGRDTRRISLKYVAPPTMDMIQRSYEPLQGSQVSLMCPVLAEPPSKVTWYKDGHRIDPGSEHRIVFREDRLYIQAVHTRDTGIYKCTATSAVGESSAEFNLNVLAPPTYKNEVTDATLRVVENVSLSFDCAVFGNPEPEITWFKDNRAVLKTNKLDAFVSSEEQTLKIASTRMLHDGVYTCIANNKVGRVERSFRLELLLPPEIHGSVDEKIRAVEGQDVSLECQASGVPIPDLAFFRKGRLVESLGLGGGRRELRIPAVKTSDAGSYVCRASNEADITEKKFHLDVRVPPSIVDQTSVSVVKVRNGGAAFLECPVKGTPSPEVSWVRNGLALSASDPRLQIRPLGLVITKTRASDAGKYACTAVNDVGSATKDFVVNVLAPPEFEDGGSDISSGAIREVLLNSPITLRCPVDGNPTPEVTWFKDDIELTPRGDRNIDITHHGQRLNVPHATEENTGLYTCKANNELGEILRHYNLQVKVPPYTAPGISDYQTLTPLEGGSLSLSCNISGNPVPAMTWLKDGLPLTPFDFPNIQFLDSGRLLNISSVEVTHSGKYMCIATSKVGSADMTFLVDVQAPAFIDGSLQDRHQTTMLHQPVTFGCPATGSPPPGIAWFHDGVPVLPSHQGVLMFQEGRLLTLQAVLPSSAGIYTCEASNVIGHASLDYILEVLVPPIIRRKNLTSEFWVVEGSTVLLQCPADGRPPPTIVWLWGAEVLSPESDSRVTISEDDHSLTLKGVRLGDRKFTCLAGNEAGTAEQDFRVHVMVLPRLEPSVSLARLVSAVVNRQTTLRCPVVGVPPPSLHWLKEGRLLRPKGDPFVQTSADGRRLLLRRVRLRDGGNYTCVAVNEAGKLEQSYVVDVQVPPRILRGPTPTDHPTMSTDTEERVQVIVNGSLSLPCVVTAQPEATLVWMRDSVPLRMSDSRLEFVPNEEALHIRNVKVSDKGKYTCIASNDAGTAEKDFHVTVLVPPRIAGPNIVKIEVVENRAFAMECHVESLPRAAVYWTRNGLPYESDNLAEGAATPHGSRRLWFPSVRASDRGNYICVAENEAGLAEKTFQVEVNVPPSIHAPEKAISVSESTPTKLRCQVSGIPTPSIFWMHEDDMLYDNNTKDIGFAENGQIVQIPNAKLEHSGRYTCVATNAAGSAEEQVTLSVLVPPRISKGPSPPPVMLQHPATLECQVEAHPTARIEWTKDGELLESQPLVRSHDGGRVLQLLRVTEELEGAYMCRAANAAGVDDHTLFLSVLVPPRWINPKSREKRVLRVTQGSDIQMECFVSGRPHPRLVWQKDAKEISRLPGHISLLQDQQTLYITHAEIEDAGRYTCSAINSAGNLSQHFELHILNPPKIVGLNDTTAEELAVPLGETLTLPCNSTGDPPPLVSWIRDGTRLSSTDPFVRFSGDSPSSHLVLKRVRLEDAGRYICVVTNSAGVAEKHFTVTVTVPASIVKPKVVAEVNVVSGERATLECSVRGLPKPTVLWFKDGLPIFGTERQNARYTFLLGGETLLVQSSGASDSGSYKCEASNPDGSDELVYKLRVVEPPDFGSRLGVTEVSMVRQGDATVIECPFLADERFPTSTRWQWNGKSLAEDLLPSNLALSLNARAIHVVRAQRDNAGRYTCTASNVAGEAHFTTLLEVLIPPSFDTISKDKISVLEGGSISLECKPHGVPDPVVSWIRDGNKIFVDNPILALFNVNQSDAGTYSCEALNEAGAAQVDFILDVLEPPWFDMSAGRFELTVLEGEEVILNCPYRGKPEPRTSWYKEGRRVHPGPSVKISNDSLTIAFARSHDSGTYVCAAISEAGTAEVNLTLTVYVPPKIHQIESSPIKAIDGHPVRLSCEASGVPAPSIKWLRSNGSSAAETSSGRATTEGGFFLDFSDGVQMEDKGRYICMAENEAGVEQEEVFLDVIAPPSINHSDWSGVDILAVSGQNTSLRCPAIGSPPPEIEWLRDGRSVQRADVAAAGEEEAFRPASRLQVDGAHGEVLNILNVQVEDAGEYLCLARNEGGTVDMKYKLEIVVPPYFPEDHPEFPASTQVVLSNHPFSLSCDVLGVPFPTFTWNKEGVPLPRDTLTRVRANRLHVSSAKEHHSGLYHCEASNVAGSAQQSYNVTILEPPRIFGSQLPMLIISVVGEPTVFECPARGFPLPSISWAKESVALDGSPRNGTLLIEETQTSDAGTYACTATNSAGIASQEFVLTVHVPPKIRDLPGTMDVVSGKPLVLECVSDGFPRPNLTWHGPVIAEAVHEHGLLRIAHIGKEHAGNYTCTAASEAGTDFKTTVLNVLTAPTIRKSSEDVVVVAGQPAILWCNTSGDPAPQVTWHKDNRHLQDDSDAFEILPNAVYIYTANVSDSGQYVCTVQNHVGSSQAVRNLDVLDPPAITVFYPEERTVVQGSEVSLVCQARGHPKPTVYWEHNGNLISNQEESLNQRYIFVTGGELKIPVAEVKEAGEYRCTAKNQAGWDTRTTTVTVHVPPTILKEGQEEELTLQRGGQAVLRCKADGFPLPTIRWTREGDPISNPRARTEASGDLIIDSAELDDSGSYVCVATNAAGVHHRVVSLAVLVPPSISRLPRDQEVAIGQPLELSCQAHGSPAPTITWTVNDTAVTGRKEETSEGVSVLALDSVSQLDQGTYVCVAANDVGQHKASADVKVRVPPRILESPTAQETHEGRRAMLHCVAQGDPPPKVFWLKDGHQVPTVNSHVQQFPNGTIIISPTKPNDTGEYRCLATNKFGVSEAGAAVTILTPPSFTIKPQDTLVEKGSSLALDCSAQGIPPPEQSWSKLGHVNILASNRVALLTNGTLRIHMVNEADEGLYQCKSRSKAGVATANVQVKVKVAGGWSSWSPWGNCSSHCGGYRSRSRRCDNPAPRNCGLQCLGEASEVAPCLDCPESVNGGWSPWSLWSQCTASCGGGTRTRSRLCNSPTPAFGGKPCQGNDVQTDFCNSSACPVHGGWSDWSTWGECSATCGRRHRRRFRTCSNPEPSHGGRTCIGTDQDVKRCAPKPCPDLSNDEDMLGGQKALLELRARSIDFADSVACSKGYVMRHGTCEDLNECLDDDRCQHKCENLQGSYKCTCPPGYRIAIDAYSCQDIDECEEDDLNCGRNHICFNARGSYQCMYAPCPANYVRDTEGSSCRLSCGEDAACEPKAHFADVLTFKTVALPSGVTAGRDVVRLSARDHDSALLAHTLFTVLSNKRNVPFDVRVSKGVGIVFATEDLPAGSQYRVTLHATTRDDANKTALFETRFFLFVSTSLYPY